MNPFLKACGATGPLRLSVECQGAPHAETVEFDQPFLLIGRDPASDLHFPHADVSERHAYLQVVGGHLCYVDLGSRAGTYLEGRCLRSGWLPLHKTLRIGPYRIRLLGGIADEPVKTAAPVAGAPGFGLPPLKDAAPAPLTLELSHRGLRSSLCPIHGELTLVGSSADCDVRVLDPSVSNYHASILHTPAGIWVVDLLGLAGLTVNGDATRFARVEDGDELRVGHSLIQVRCNAHRAISDGTLELESEDHESGAGEPAPPADLLPVAAQETTPRTMLSEPLPADVVDTFLSPLVDQFRLMQREMFEQLRHELSEELGRTGAELLRELSAAHQEHARSLKRELDHFQRLNQELDVLKAELSAWVSTPNHGRGGPDLPTRPTRLGMAAAAPMSRPFHLNAEAALSPARSGYQNGVAPKNEAADTSPFAPAMAMVPGEPDPRDEPNTTAATAEEAQTWLYQRISMIQDEQQGRWQRLLDMVPGQLLSRLPV
ncbi:MAG: FHA domain-containing protein [Isosphaeraceae bacterium]|nr:FHA domain-containing protein [Isosphaeraceae bacterium]